MRGFHRSITTDQFQSIDSSESDVECGSPNTFSAARRGRDTSPTKCRARSKSRARSIASKMVGLAQDVVSPRKQRSKFRDKGRESDCDELGESKRSTSSQSDQEVQESPQLSRPALLSPPSILNMSGSALSAESQRDEHQRNETINNSDLDGHNSNQKSESKRRTWRPSSPLKAVNGKSRRSHSSFSDLNLSFNGFKSPRRPWRSKTKSKTESEESGSMELSETSPSSKPAIQEPPDLHSKPQSKQSSRSRYENIVKDAEQWRSQFQKGSHLTRKLERAQSISEHGEPGTQGIDDLQSVSHTVIGLVTPSRTKRGASCRLPQNQNVMPGMPKLFDKEEREREYLHQPESPRHRHRSRDASSATRHKGRSPKKDPSPRSPIKEPRKKIKSSQQSDPMSPLKLPKDHGTGSRSSAVSVVSSRARSRRRERCPPTPSKATGYIGSAYDEASTRRGDVCPTTPGRTNEQHPSPDDVTVGNSTLTPASNGRQRTAALSQEMKNGLLAGIKKELEPQEAEPILKTPTRKSKSRRSKSVGRRTPHKGSNTPLTLKLLATPGRKDSSRDADDKSSCLRQNAEVCNATSPKRENGSDLSRHIVSSPSTNSLSGRTKDTGRSRIKVRKKQKEPATNVNNGAAAQLQFDDRDLDVAFLVA